ncbi:hypothetical protein HaLaN_03790, partial [Haematococcus lacustris]
CVGAACQTSHISYASCTRYCLYAASWHIAIERRGSATVHDGRVQLASGRGLDLCSQMPFNVQTQHLAIFVQEYSPPGYVQQRSASAGRLRQLGASTEPRPYSALPSQALMYSTAGLQPMNRLPPGGVPPALYGMQHSPLAWRAESAGGAPPSLSGLPKPKRPSLHVQSLAIAKDREELAEEVVQLRQSELRLKNDLEKAKKEERTLAEQLSRTRQAQTTAEQLLRNKQRVAGGGM